ncbi:MAG: DUF1569 domain-containing protein [Pirellulales bacterium]
MTAISSRSAAHAAPCVQIKTAKVTGRRKLHFTSLGDMLADAEMLCSMKPVHALGNWQLGRALEHLARTIDMSLDGARFKAPWYIRLLGPLFKKRLLSRPMSPGFRLPANAAKFLIPEDECELHEALRHLRTAVTRSLATTHRHSSPVFGHLTSDEWNQLHFRHAELHLSFFVPG